MIFYANVIPYANKTNKTNARNKQLCKEYMIYILSNNYNIIVEKTNENPKKKIIMIYAHWQMLFKSISSATYVSLRIALKKIAKKEKKKRKPTTKTEKQFKKCLKHYMTILYYTITRSYHLKYIAYCTITILFVGQV